MSEVVRGAAGCSVLPMLVEHLPAVLAEEEQLHFAPWTMGNFTDSLAAGHEAWVLIRAGELIGYAVVLRVIDEAHLLNIGIARHVQGQGLGAFLLHWLHRHAEDTGANSFFLEVRASNLAALALYRRLAYEQIGIRRRYYAAPQGREDAVVMRCALGAGADSRRGGPR